MGPLDVERTPCAAAGFARPCDVVLGRPLAVGVGGTTEGGGRGGKMSETWEGEGRGGGGAGLERAALPEDGAAEESEGECTWVGACAAASAGITRATSAAAPLLGVFFFLVMLAGKGKRAMGWGGGGEKSLNWEQRYTRVRKGEGRAGRGRGGKWGKNRRGEMEKGDEVVEK